MTRPPDRLSSAFLSLLLILAVTLLAWAPSFWNGFVVDDEVYVLANPHVRGEWNPKGIFTSTYPPDHPEQGLYRPLVTLSYWFDCRIWGIHPTGEWNGFHLTNAFWHGSNGFLLLLLLRRLGLSMTVALVSSLLFAVHPALSEAVAWVAGRAELMGLFFGLISLILFLGRSHRILRGISLGFWILAVSCKETWLVLPAMALILQWIFFPGTSRRSLAVWGCLHILGMILFWGIRSQIVGSWSPPLAAYQGVVSDASRIFTALMVLWKYVGAWFVPTSLSIHHEIQPITDIPTGLKMVISWLPVLGLAFWKRNTWPWLTAVIAWFWVMMFPVSNLLVPIGAVYGERFLYAGSVLFFPGVVLFAQWLWNRVVQLPPLKPVKILLIILLGLAGIMGGWKRLRDWQGPITIWESASQIYPRSAVIKGALAEAYVRVGRFFEAHQLAQEALQQFETMPSSYRQLMEKKLVTIHARAQAGVRNDIWQRKFLAANQLAQQKQIPEALAAYQKLIEESPEYSQTHEALGDFYMRLLNHVAARQSYEEVLRLGTSTPAIWAKYGHVLSESGRKEDALMAYDKSIELDPEDPLTHYNRGIVLGDIGEFTDALASFKRASALSPEFASPHLNTAAIFIHQKRFDEARMELNQVLSLNPRQREALELLEKIPGAVPPPAKTEKKDAKPAMKE